MPPQEKYSILRSLLKTFGLSPEAIDDIIDRISSFLADKDEKAPQQVKFPYRIRDDFLSSAERSFFGVLQGVVKNGVVICLKVALGDLFYTKSSDPSEFRIYTNKIDRKHVDFLLCDPLTLRPLVGIELDDRSHQREDRQARDEFVDGVFEAAGLPLLHFPVKYAYTSAELESLLTPYLGKTVEEKPEPVPAVPAQADPPRCPKCGSEMLLRTAKTGSNSGSQFWGCPNYPRCKGIVPLKK